MKKLLNIILKTELFFIKKTRNKYRDLSKEEKEAKQNREVYKQVQKHEKKMYGKRMSK